MATPSSKDKLSQNEAPRRPPCFVTVLLCIGAANNRTESMQNRHKYLLL